MTRPAAAEPTLGTLLQDFFCLRLQEQRGASPNTVASYRDTFRLLLQFAAKERGLTPSRIKLADLDAQLVLAFLHHLEHERGNCPRTRNVRLAAIRAFFAYAGLRVPTALGAVQRVAAIPFKRFDRPEVGYLTRPEVEALLAAPLPATWIGQRDRTLFQVLYNTGARVSEVAGLNIADADLGRGPSLRFRGKGRKERSVPIWSQTRRILRAWSQRIPTDPSGPVFPGRGGQRLSRSGIQARLDAAVRRASDHCPSLRRRHVTPHRLRHTTAMHLLESGVDISVIALWLGHESPATTHIYLQADLRTKERALAALRPTRQATANRFKPSDRLLAFLDRL